MGRPPSPRRGGRLTGSAHPRRSAGGDQATTSMRGGSHLVGYDRRMASFPTVRVAAAQATPVILDAEACVEKAAGLLHAAADAGAQLAVLPECFIPLYPSNAWARGAAGFAGWDELWERLWENAVDVPGPLLDRLCDVCRERTMYCAIGVNERESERPGT